MSADEFRRIAASFPEAVESAHMDHPDFRVRGKIFATLGYPDESWAVVKFTPDQQQDFVARDPDLFQAVEGGWGRRGSTNLFLAKATSAVVQKALALAWRNTAPKRLGNLHREV